VLIDLPLDVQRELIEYNPWFDSPLEVHKPRAPRKQIEAALDLLAESKRPVIVAGGGVINADACDLLVELAELTNTPVVPTLMGWGAIPDDHPLMAGMVGLQTQHRYGNATFLKSDFVLGLGNRWANRHTGSIEVYTKGRKFVHVDVDPMQIGRVFGPDLGIVSDAKSALEQFVAVARERKSEKRLPDRSRWVAEVQKRKRTMLRRSDYKNTPIKPQRVFHEINRAWASDADRESTCFVSSIGLGQIASGQFQKVFRPRNYIICGQAGPLGWIIPACIGVKLAAPSKEVVGVGGDYDFQFMIEELAVAAQFNVPFVMILINNSYLGLIRQAQKGYKMDYEVQLSFRNINSPELGEYGVDFVKVVEGLGCKAIRVFDPENIQESIQAARKMTNELRVPVVVEVLTERVTDIAMGPEIDKITEFEEVIDVEEEEGFLEQLAA
jgi:tartronate-semialdehyde synthase